jgi:hypothetical protein
MRIYYGEENVFVARLKAAQINKTFKSFDYAIERHCGYRTVTDSG